MMARADAFYAFDGLAASKDNLRVQCQTGTLVSKIVAVIQPFLIAAPPLEILAEAFLPSALDPDILVTATCLTEAARFRSAIGAQSRPQTPDPESILIPLRDLSRPAGFGPHAS
jgi:hypothetical protein